MTLIVPSDTPRGVPLDSLTGMARPKRSVARRVTVFPVT
jgi:hypothetical protein